MNLKKLLHLYNDGHQPFIFDKKNKLITIDNRRGGRGGLGYHPTRMYGGTLFEDEEGNIRWDGGDMEQIWNLHTGVQTDINPSEIQMTDKGLLYNGRVISDEYIPKDEDEEEEEDLKQVYDDAFNPDTGLITEIDNPEFEAMTMNHKLSKLYTLVEYTDTDEFKKVGIHDIFKKKLNELLDIEGITLKEFEDANIDEDVEIDIEEITKMNPLKQQIKDISRDKGLGYGLAFENFLVDRVNKDVLKDDNIKFTSSLSHDHPILDSRIVLGGKPAQLKDVIVYDLFSDNCVYEIKNFGMDTQYFKSKSYKEISDSNDPYIDIQCTKIEGNMDFKPVYVLYNDDTFKIFNIMCNRSGDMILPQNDNGYDFKIIVMLKDGIYEYKPLDDIFDFIPSQNVKGKNLYIKDIEGKKLGQLYIPNPKQPFTKIIKNKAECYKLDIKNFKKI